LKCKIDNFPDDLKKAENEINMMSTNVWENEDQKPKTKKEKQEDEKEVIKRKDIEVERIERLGDGVWKPIHQIIECENEGWTSLLKGFIIIIIIFYFYILSYFILFFFFLFYFFLFYFILLL